MNKQLTTLSKFLSLVLRHTAENGVWRTEAVSAMYLQFPERA